MIPAKRLKEPLINHQKFITIDRFVHEGSIFVSLIPNNPLVEAQMGIVSPDHALSSFSRDRPARASM